MLASGLCELFPGRARRLDVRTDEKGILTVEFPDNIPGDEIGNLTIVTQIEDHEEFGTLINSKEMTKPASSPVRTQRYKALSVATIKRLDSRS